MALIMPTVVGHNLLRRPCSALTSPFLGAGSRLRSGALGAIFDPDKMSEAGNAGIVVSHVLLAQLLQGRVGEIERVADEADEILLDAPLVLRRQRYDPR